MTGSQMPSHLQLIFFFSFLRPCLPPQRKRCSGLDKWGTGRRNYLVTDLQLVHATALCDRAVTRFMLAAATTTPTPPPSVTITNNTTSPQAEISELIESSSFGG